MILIDQLRDICYWENALSTTRQGLLCDVTHGVSQRIKGSRVEDLSGTIDEEMWEDIWT